MIPCKFILQGIVAFKGYPFLQMIRDDDVQPGYSRQIP